MPTPKSLQRFEATVKRAEAMTEVSGRTEVSNALRLAHACVDVLRHVNEWERWIVWDGQRWASDTGDVFVQEKAGIIADALWKEADACSNLIVKAEVLSFAKHSNSAAGLANMVKIARGKLPLRANLLDTNPWLLNCPNGTIDLRTGKLRPHLRSDYITKLCPTPYVPSAPCPTWLRFLADVFAGDLDLIDYINRVFGYGITGDVSEQILPILWGPGGNGKSTLINALMFALGTDYGGTPPRELFSLTKGYERHPAYLMTLKGRRLMVAQETDAGCSLNEPLIKCLTGCDIITARGMRENFTSFPPSHKLLLCTNHRPKILGTDYAIWRRLQLIPFEVTFKSPKSRGYDRSLHMPLDSLMPEKLKAEAQGILAWLVRGALEWRRDGLNPPESVILATEEYAGQEDVIGRFIAECCALGEYEEMAMSLFRAFQRAFPESEMSQTAFGRELASRGYGHGYVTSGPLKGRKIRRGLKLN
jgi:putative DNA primase/helicase